MNTKKKIEELKNKLNNEKISLDEYKKRLNTLMIRMKKKYKN